MCVASGCGEQEAGVASGSGWNLWVWLLGVVVRRYIDFLILLIPTPLVSVTFFILLNVYIASNDIVKRFIQIWCAVMLVVPMKKGAIHICVDLKQLNENVLKEVHPLPIVDETLAQLAGAKISSKLDVNSGFWQIPLAKRS